MTKDVFTLSYWQANSSKDLLRGSEVAIADEYNTYRTMTTAPMQKIEPFHEQPPKAPQTAKTYNFKGAQMPEWEKSSAMRNMAGTQSHYMLYLKSLRHKHDHDNQNHTKRVGSGTHRIQLDL